jgi:hypothetical protein
MKKGATKSRKIIPIYRYSDRGIFWEVYKVGRAGDRGIGCTGKGRFSGTAIRKTGKNRCIYEK